MCSRFTTYDPYDRYTHLLYCLNTHRIHSTHSNTQVDIKAVQWRHLGFYVDTKMLLNFLNKIDRVGTVGIILNCDGSELKFVLLKRRNDSFDYNDAKDINKQH